MNSDLRKQEGILLRDSLGLGLRVFLRSPDGQGDPRVLLAKLLQLHRQTSSNKRHQHLHIQFRGEWEMMPEDFSEAVKGPHAQILEY